MYVQLQQDPVGVTVDKSLLALLAEVLLEGTDSLGVVSFQAADNLGYLGRPLLGVFVVWVRHDGQCCYVMWDDVWSGVLLLKLQVAQYANIVVVVEGQGGK